MCSSTYKKKSRVISPNELTANKITKIVTKFRIGEINKGELKLASCTNPIINDKLTARTYKLNHMNGILTEDVFI